MLLSQNGCRDENRALFAVHRRLVRRTNRNFGFAEADISANEPVHRSRAFHVAFHVRNGTNLVGRLFVRKCVLEFGLSGVVFGEGETRRLFAAGVNVQKFFGNVFDGGSGFGFGTRPITRAET